MASLTFYNNLRTIQTRGVAADGTTAAAAVDFDTDKIYIALVSASYTTNPITAPTTTDSFWSTPQAFEVSGTGYTAGGILLNACSVTISANTVKVLLAQTGANVNPTWFQQTGGFANARWAIIYKVLASGNTAANSPLIAAIDLGSVQGNVNGDFAIGFDQASLGAFTFT